MSEEIGFDFLIRAVKWEVAMKLQNFLSVGSHHICARLMEESRVISDIWVVMG